MANTLRKAERLHSKKLIERLFSGGARSFSVYPLRVVYLPVEELEEEASVLISVSKRHFKRAVKRNRVKRQVREAYRKNKQVLLEVLERQNMRLAIAFIYLSDDLSLSTLIETRVRGALLRIVEKVKMTEEVTNPDTNIES